MINELDSFAEMYPEPTFRDTISEILSLGIDVSFTRKLDYDSRTKGFSVRFAVISTDPPIIGTGETVKECRDSFLANVPASLLPKQPSLRLVFSSSDKPPT